MYGGNKSSLEEAIGLGLLPNDLKSYRQSHFVTFDLETLEKDQALNSKIDVEGVHKLASIGCASTLPAESRYFERRSSRAEDSTELVAEFLDHMFELEKLYIQTVPQEIKDAVPEEEEDEYYKNVGKTKRLENQLRKYLSMPILGYNSSKLICYKSHIIWSI